MWQPIETAPRNHTFLAVLNCAGEQTICTMRWPVAEAKNSRPDNKTFHVERVTHWMPLPELPGAQPKPSVPDGWKEAAIAWEVCGSLHREYAKGKDPFFKKRQEDFVKHANDARTMLAAAPKPEGV